VENKKVFVGYAGFRFNDPHTHAIGTNKEEVEKFLIDSMKTFADEVSDCCESDHIFALESPCINECFDLGNDQSMWVDEETNQDHIGSAMNDEAVIKLGILDEICITSDIVRHNGTINLVASYEPFTADGFNNPDSVEVRMGYMDYSFDTATGLIVYDLLDEIDREHVVTYTVNDNFQIVHIS
jgi:hypothetical protein